MPKKRFITRTAGSVVLAFVLAAAVGEVAAEQGPRYHFRHFGSEQDLGQMTVTALLQDEVGFLWVGTQEGLLRFDGHSFERFDHAAGLPSTYIYALHLTIDGSLWVGTDSGLACRDETGFSEVGPSEGLVPLEIPPQGISSDATGRVFVAHRDGPYVLRDGRFQPLVPDWPRGRVSALLAEPEGAVWFAGTGWLARWEAGTLEQWGTEAGLPNERIDALLHDSAGRLWVRSSRHLVYREAGSGRFEDRTGGLPSANYFGFLYQTRSGDVWASSDLGLARLTAEGHWDVIGQGRGLSGDAVNVVLEDREGLLWVGLAGNGLDCAVGYPDWEAYTKREGLSNDAVWAVSRDARGALWVGTDRGLNRRDPASGAWRAWHHADGLSGESAYALEHGPGDQLYVGFIPGGVSRIHTVSGAITHLGLEGERVYDLALEPDASLWAATTAGLQRLDPDTRRFEAVEVPGGSVGERFLAVELDGQGRLWAGGRDGLALRQAGRWRRLTEADGLLADNIFSLSESRDGALWICYMQGLGTTRLELRGERAVTTHLTSADGLASDAVQHVVEDRAGRLWLATPSGLNLLEGHDLKHFGRSDGLVGDASIVFVDADSSLWIGTSRGLAHYRPAEPRQPYAPTAVLLSASLGGEPVPVDRPAEVDYSRRTFSVHFAGLSLRKPEGVRFRYRLAGLEDAPTVTTQREARYPQLPPGAYSFSVDCQSAAGVWSPEPARFEFVVAPPWYRTASALALAVVLLAAGAGLGHKLRVRRLVEARHHLEEAIHERTAELERKTQTVEQQARQLLEAAEGRRRFHAMVVHDIKNPLTPIVTGVESVEDSLEPGDPRHATVETMRAAVGRLLFLAQTYTHALEGPLDDARPERREFPIGDLVADLAMAYGPTAEKRGLRLLVDGEHVDVMWEGKRGGAMVRAPADALYRAAENIMNNALHYATGELRITVEETDQRVALIVENEGPRISDADKDRIFGLYQQADGARLGTGVGLASAKRQLEEVGGTILVKDAEPSGARFEVWLPRVAQGEQD